IGAAALARSTPESWNWIVASRAPPRRMAGNIAEFACLVKLRLRWIDPVLVTQLYQNFLAEQSLKKHRLTSSIQILSIGSSEEGRGTFEGGTIKRKKFNEKACDTARGYGRACPDPRRFYP